MKPRLIRCLTPLLLIATVAFADPPKPCVFCEIVAGTRQQEAVVYRDDAVVAFLSIGQRNPGHVLIVPAVHAGGFLDVPAETMHRMTDVAKLLAEAIGRTDLRMDGFQLQMSNGKAAGQSVFHAHLHVIPRFDGDSPVPASATEPASRGETGQAEAQPPPKRAGDPFPQEVLAPVAAKIRAALAAEPELTPIFNGRDLAGWQTAGIEQFWRAEDGVLVGENDDAMTASMLRTEKRYGDFVLEFDVRWSGEIDSGIEFRQPVIQLQLGVSRSLKRDMSGSFYVGKPGYPEPGRANNAAALMKPTGEWNSFRLRAQGPVFTVWINGTQAVEFTDAGFAGPAPLGFQIHGGLKMKVEYRNIRLAEL